MLVDTSPFTQAKTISIPLHIYIFVYIYICWWIHLRKTISIPFHILLKKRVRNVTNKRIKILLIGVIFFIFC